MILAVETLQLFKVLKRVVHKIECIDKIVSLYKYSVYKKTPF